MTVGCGLARGLLELAVTKGAPRRALVERSGIDADKLHDPDHRVPLAHYIALFRAGKELCADPALALHYGEVIDLSAVSIVGLICHASETMMEAFAQMNRYGRLAIEVDVGGDRFRHVRDADGLWLEDMRRNPNDFPELTESTFARMVCGTRQFGETPFVRAVEVTHAEPDYRAEYDRIFRAPIAFATDRNRMLLDESWMTHRIALLPRYVFGILSKHAEELLAALQSSKSMRGRVEALLMAILHTGEANIEAIATKLGVSRQTLYRSLKTEDVTFETVLDELRHRMALDYLDGGKASINEIAYLVGFSEPAAFSRAFKRWTGASPREHRR